MSAKMKFMRKYWYILFGNFAFLFLCFHTLMVHESRSNSTKSQVYANFFYLGIVFMGMPTIFVSALTESTDSLFVSILPVICFYLTGIYATYRHTKWREEHFIS